jgi:hypothetical protein
MLETPVTEAFHKLQWSLNCTDDDDDDNNNNNNNNNNNT